MSSCKKNAGGKREPGISVAVGGHLEGRINCAGIRNLYRQKVQPSLMPEGFYRLPNPSVGRIPEYRHRSLFRDELLQQIEPLRCRLRRLKAQPSDISAWVSEALDVSVSDRICRCRHHDGDRRRRLPQSSYRGSAAGSDDVYIETNQFRSERRKTIRIARAAARFCHVVLAVLVAALLHAGNERPHR